MISIVNSSLEPQVGGNLERSTQENTYAQDNLNAVKDITSDQLVANFIPEENPDSAGQRLESSSIYLSDLSVGNDEHFNNIDGLQLGNNGTEDYNELTSNQRHVDNSPNIAHFCFYDVNTGYPIELSDLQGGCNYALVVQQGNFFKHFIAKPYTPVVRENVDVDLNSSLYNQQSEETGVANQLYNNPLDISKPINYENEENQQEFHNETSQNDSVNSQPEQGLDNELSVYGIPQSNQLQNDLTNDQVIPNTPHMDGNHQESVQANEDERESNGNTQTKKKTSRKGRVNYKENEAYSMICNKAERVYINNDKITRVTGNCVRSRQKFYELNRLGFKKQFEERKQLGDERYWLYLLLWAYLRKDYYPHLRIEEREIIDEIRRKRDEKRKEIYEKYKKKGSI